MPTRCDGGCEDPPSHWMGMSLIDDLAGLGFTTPNESTEPDAHEVEDGPHEATLEIGSPTAQVLYQFCSGQPCVVVKSPPGGGKSTLMATVVAHLVNTMDLRVTVATNTHEQAAGMGAKLMEQIAANRIDLRCKNVVVPPELAVAKNGQRKIPLESDGGRVMVRTLASLAYENSKADADLSATQTLLLVDEAYQAHFTNGVTAAAGFAQLILVGDPGQIDPVVTQRVDAYRAIKRAPHRPFAEVMEHDSRSSVININHTYRLGEDTTSLIAPFYDFEFDSRRVPTWVEAGGKALSELSHVSIDSSSEARVAEAVSRIASSHIGMTYHRDGHNPRPITQSDIAVVVAVNTLLTATQAALGSLGLHDVTVGTADKLQGGEWPVVIAVDPLAGSRASAHHLNIGRLCVMLSRHNARLVFCHDEQWSDEIVDMPNESVHRSIRSMLTGGPVRS